MRTRHHPPAIFNLSLVDVLCCALGCVIVLWLLNFRQARDRARAAEHATAALAGTRADLEAKSREAAAERDRLQLAARRAEAAEKERDAARTRAAEQDQALAALRAEKAAAEERLAKQTDEQLALAKQLADTQRQAKEFERQSQDREKLVQQLRSELEAVAALRDQSRDKLTSATKQVQQLEKEITDRRRDLSGIGQSVQYLQATNARLTNELAAAGRKVSELQGERQSLLDQLKRSRTAADGRFAGIQLTGRRVVFLVDMSGSMELTDERTPSSGKWQAVRETLAKVMKSLPELEKYQVILFSDRVSYPLGNESGWLTYDAMSADRTLNALAAVRPVGDTNLYAAFAAAFRLRPEGLDTVYLFSDGLPSIGEGMTTEQARQLRETERNDLLSKQVRKALLTDWNRPLPDRPRVKINAIGFFYESPDVGAFLWALAREHDGAFVGMSKP